MTDVTTRTLLTTAARLFPRENAERLALIRDLVKAHYDPPACDAVLRAHAAGNDWLSLPKLGEEMQNAHRDRGTELAAIRGAAARHAERHRARDRAEVEAAARDAAETDAVLARAGWRGVRRAVRRVLAAQPWLKKPWKRHGLGSTMRAMVRGELAKGSGGARD